MRDRRIPALVGLIIAALLLHGCVATTAGNPSADMPQESGDAMGVIKAWKAADAAYARGELAAARRGYQAVLGAQPGNVAVILRLGNIAYALGRPERARALYERGLEKAPRDARLLYNLAMLDLSRGYRNLVRYREATHPRAVANEIEAVIAMLERMADAEPRKADSGTR